MEGGDSEFVNFTLFTLNAVLEAIDQKCVWQQAITCCSCYRMPRNAFFHELVIFRSTKKWRKDTFLFCFSFFFALHPHSPVIFAAATLVAFVLLGNSGLNFYCYTQREATPTQKSARKWRCDFSRLLARKITKGINSWKPASLNCPIHKDQFTFSHFSWPTRIHPTS